MSTTTLIPLDPAISLQRSTRILSISARLLPEEIVAARQARRTRAWVIVAVVLVVGLCAAWFALAHHQKQEADQELTTAMNSVTELQRDQRGFAETVKVRNDTATLTDQLTTVMASDLDWSGLLTILRGAGVPSNVELSSVNGSLAVATGATQAAPDVVLPSTDGATSIGSLVITGVGPDKRAIAAYAEALGRQKNLTNPYVTSVSAAEDIGGVTFSLKVGITSAALCGRFTVACKNSGGN